MFLCVKCSLVKIAMHNKVLKCGTHFEADNIRCMQPLSSKDGKALQNFYTFSHSAASLEGDLAQNG